MDNKEMKQLIEQICRGLPEQVRRDDEPVKKITTRELICDVCNQVITKGRMGLHLKSAKHKKRTIEFQKELLIAHEEN